MAESDLEQYERTRSVIGAFYKVYKKLEFGYLESFYKTALEYELKVRGHEVVREYAVRVMYEHIDLGFHRLDMVVDRQLVIEVKSTSVLPGIAYRQLRSYLRSTGLELGLLLHFGPSPRVVRVFVPNSRRAQSSPPRPTGPQPR